jgi:hypothetical protein
MHRGKATERKGRNIGLEAEQERKKQSAEGKGESEGKGKGKGKRRSATTSATSATNILPLSDRKMREVMERFGAELNGEQLNAMASALQGQNTFLVGGVDVGKTFTVDRIQAAMKHLGVRCLCLATSADTAMKLNCQTVDSWLDGISVYQIKNGMSNIINIAKKRLEQWQIDVLIIDGFSRLQEEYEVAIHAILSEFRKPLATKADSKTGSASSSNSNSSDDDDETEEEDKRGRQNIKHAAYGGVKVIFTGDYCHTASFKSDECYSRFFFESALWKLAAFKEIYLHRSMSNRYSRSILDLLHRMRIGKVLKSDEKDLESLVRREGQKRERYPELDRMFSHYDQPPASFSPKFTIPVIQTITNIAVTQNETLSRFIQPNPDGRKMFKSKGNMGEVPPENRVHARHWLSLMRTTSIPESINLFTGAQVMVVGGAVDNIAASNEDTAQYMKSITSSGTVVQMYPTFTWDGSGPTPTGVVVGWTQDMVSDTDGNHTMFPIIICDEPVNPCTGPGEIVGGSVSTPSRGPFTVKSKRWQDPLSKAIYIQIPLALSWSVPIVNTSEKIFKELRWCNITDGNISDARQLYSILSRITNLQHFELEYFTRYQLIMPPQIIAKYKHLHNKLASSSSSSTSSSAASASTSSSAASSSTSAATSSTASTTTSPTASSSNSSSTASTTTSSTASTSATNSSTTFNATTSSSTASAASSTASTTSSTASNATTSSAASNTSAATSSTASTATNRIDPSLASPILSNSFQKLKLSPSTERFGIGLDID